MKILNLVSCIYVDWATIGTWVGGIGAASAAAAAVWIARADTYRRSKYAEFLFWRDVEKLKLIEVLLRQSADSMHELGIFRGQHPDEEGEKEIRNIGFRALAQLSGQLEYFGRSERLFEYSPRTREFAELGSSINEIFGIPEEVNLTLNRFDEVSASEAISRRLEKLTNALRHFTNDPKNQKPRLFGSWF